MPNKKGATKLFLTYGQKVWDNYNPYYPHKQPSDEQLKMHEKEVALERLHNGYAKLGELAGHKPSTNLINKIINRILNDV